MKRLVLVALLIVGCNRVPGEPINTTNDGDFSEQDVTLANGDVIHCLFWGAGQGSQYAIGGMSCDWRTYSR